MATVSGNRRRLHTYERGTASALAVAYGTHPAVQEWAGRISTTASPTDTNLTQAVFAFRAGLAGYRFTAAQMIEVATAEAARMGRADALDLVGATQDLNDAPFYGDAGSSGDVANGIDLIANDAPHRLAAALMARLGLGGYLTAAQQVIAATLGRVLLANREQIAAAYRAAQHDVYAAAPDVAGWVWISELMPFTCGYCYAQHGTWHADTDIMETHPWCVPAGTLAAGPNVVAASTRPYHGRMLTIITTLGHNLAITPNHPVLTARGWVPAGQLIVGDEVVSSSNPEGVVRVIDPNHYQPETLIEEIAAALTVASGMLPVRMPQTAEDFHGDGCPDNDVDVVRAARVGDGDGNTITKERQKVSFVGAAGPTRVGLGSTLLGFQGLDSAAKRLVGRLRVEPSLLCGQSRVPYEARFARATLLHPRPVERVDDRTSAHAKALRDRLHGLPGLVRRDYVRDIVVADDWSGHVYNLQTDGGWYAANGIVVHNCGCSQEPSTLSAAEYAASEPILGTEVFAALPSKVQRTILGPSRYDLYRSGIALETMIGDRGMLPVHQLRRLA